MRDEKQDEKALNGWKIRRRGFATLAGVDTALYCATREVMRTKAAILLTVLLALLVTPMQLPAASCRPAKARDREACKSDCCAKKKCCVTSEEESGVASQPLLSSSGSKQLVIGLFDARVIGSHFQPYPTGRVCRAAPVRAHALPPLAATCIRLI